MKKFLLLSFVMVLFTCAISFAQSGTHYSSNGIYRLNPSISRTNGPNGQIDVDMFASVSPVAVGPSVTLISLNIMNDSYNELPTGGTTFDFYNETHSNGPLNLHAVYDDSLYFRTTYAWIVEYSDGSHESYYETVYR